MTIILTDSLPTAIIGQTYRVVMLADAGSSPSWSIESGVLPSGITLSVDGILESDGLVSATIFGVYPIVIRVVNTDLEESATEEFLLVVDNAIEHNICFNSSFYIELGASGGTPPYTFSIVGGYLPPSLVLSDNAILGIATHFGTYLVTIRVLDSELAVISDIDITFIVSPKLELDIEGISAVIPSEVYSQQLVIRGFAPGEGTILLNNVQLPTGLTFNSGTNTISGTTAVQYGVFPITTTLSVGDCTNMYNFNLIVYRLAIDPISLCVFPNVPYYAKLFTLNGIAPFTWEVTGVALPDYLTLNVNTGEVTGSASTETVVYTSVRITDGLGSVVSTDLTVTVSTICGDSSTWGSNTDAPPVSPGRAPWISSLPSAIMLVGCGYFEDNLIKYLPAVYGE